MPDGSQFPSVVKMGKKASDLAYEALCKSIVEGELKPGHQIREVEIAKTLGLSRTPIRDALRKLEEHHLLTRQINGACSVAEWDKRTLMELATLRGTLESLAISLAIKNFQEEDYIHLEELAGKMDRLVKRNDFEQLILLDIQFHHYIWSRSGHALLQETLTQMTPQIRYFMMLTRPGDEVQYPETHQELIAVLRQGDAAKAREKIQAHILVTAEHLIAQLDID